MTSQLFKDCFGDLPQSTQDNLITSINAIINHINKEKLTIYSARHIREPMAVLQFEGEQNVPMQDNEGL